MMTGLSSTAGLSHIPKHQNYKRLALWRLYVTKFMYQDSVLYILSRNLPDTGFSTAAVKGKVKENDENAKSHMVLNVREIPVTMVRLLVLLKRNTTKLWKELESAI